MEETKQGGALPTERATERTEYEAMRAQELQDARPRTIALTPEQVQTLAISEETATWISAYTKVQEMYEYIYYAYVFSFTEECATDKMIEDGVLDLWSELGDKVMKNVGWSIGGQLGCITDKTI